MKLSNILFVVGLVVAYNYVQRNRKKPPVFYIKKLAKNYNARTIPPFGIFIKDDEKENKELLNHELVHWKQYEEKGLVNYYVDYGKQMNQFGYDKMPMEIEARKNESYYCKQNYTNCVRNGTARTIYNPNFRT